MLGKKTIWVLLISTHLLCLNLFGQASRIDSLKSILKTELSSFIFVQLHYSFEGTKLTGHLMSKLNQMKQTSSSLR